jgi:hypothetical protein
MSVKAPKILKCHRSIYLVLFSIAIFATQSVGIFVYSNFAILIATHTPTLILASMSLVLQIGV